MKVLLKIAMLACVLAALAPALAPGSSIAVLVRAAVEDAGSFCDRRPQACHQGAELARETGAIISKTLSSLTVDAPAPTEAPTGDEGAAPGPDALTAQDRALAVPQSAQDRKSSFAGNNTPAHY